MLFYHSDRLIVSWRCSLHRKFLLNYCLLAFFLWTGDNLLTGVYVARQSGIIQPEDTVIQVKPQESSLLSTSSPSLLSFEVLNDQIDLPITENTAWICEILRKLTETPLNGSDIKVITTVATEEVYTDTLANVRLVMTGITWNFICKKVPQFLPMVSSPSIFFSLFFHCKCWNHCVLWSQISSNS